MRELERLQRDQPQLGDWWTYLRGRTLAQAEKHAEAMTAFERVEAQEPPSAFRSKARFARADALRALGRVADAQAIYENEAQRLLGRERQEELASIYFDLADTLSIAPEGASPEASMLDPDRAFELYRKVLALDVRPATRERALWRAVECRRMKERWPEVVTAAQEHRREFDPASKLAKDAGAHVFEVREMQAAALAKQNDLLGARRAYEDLSAAIADVRARTETWAAWRSGASEATLAGLSALDGRALYARAATYDFGAAQSPLAIGVLQRFLESFPEHELAPQATFDLADRLQKLGRTDDALAALDALLARSTPATQDPTQLEQFESLRMAALFKKGELLAAAERFDEATATFNQYVARYPTGPAWTQSQQELVDIEYDVGVAARRKGEHERARALWNRFLTRHPLDARAADTQQAIGELYVEQATALREAARKEGREAVRADLDALFRSAVEQWRRIVTKYPQSAVASRSLVRIGQVQERELGDLEAAVNAYRECTFGDAAGAARVALSKMTLPSLELSTERAWRSGEKPAVRVVARNVESLKLEVYALDLEAYFRKNLSHTGVEGLDLDLIAADKTAERTLEGFEKYRRIERDLELPVSGPGVWAVAVSAAELRATTLVIASDLDVLVRNSEGEALVFVEDMPGQRAASGVRVLLAGRGEDGLPAIVEAVTDASGIATSKLELLAPGSSISVLALRDGHIATNAFAERRTVTIAKPTARGVCYTDRPAYRPGDSVKWRAIVREVVEGALAATPGRSVDVALMGPEGRAVWTGRAELSRFGTASGAIALDSQAQLGTYRLLCTTESGAVYNASLEIQRFRAPKVRLELESPRLVWFRGESVEATARASWAWGEPIAGSPLVVDLPDGRRLELTTDADGEARFELATRDFAVEQPLGIRATLTEERVSAQTTVFLALQEFRLALSTPEGAVLAGSSFDVQISARGADGEPTGARARLKVLAMRAAGGSEEVQARDLEIAAESGEAHAALTLDEGNYRLVVAAVDRFGNPIEAAQDVEVSGASDARRLRFFVASHQLEVGRKVELQLVNRSKPGLALVSFEAGKLLSHRVVQLAAGSNTVAFEVGHEYFPNFVVAAAMMGERELHADEAAFQVTRRLVVEVVPERADARPGEQLALTLRVRDQLGRPVEAELSLAVIDEALLGLYPDTTPAIRDAFESGLMRPAAFATTSSCTFRYEGVTRVVASAVLAEVERARELERWREERNQAVDRLGVVSLVPPGGPSTPGPLVTGSDDFFLGQGAAVQEFSGLAFNDVIGLGGGAGGKFGGRFGGRTRLRAAGGEADKDLAAEAELARNERDLLAFWSASVVTDAKGEATVRLEVPRASKRWMCVSRGVDTGTLVGEGQASFVAREEFFVDLRAPLELVEGDQPRFMARVHNLTGMTGIAHLVLRVEGGGATASYPQDVDLGATGDVEWTFPALARVAAVGELRVALEAEAELGGAAREGTQAARISTRPYRPKASDAATIVVRPFGVELADARGGVLRDEASFTLALDATRTFHARSVELALGPSVDALLVATALGDALPTWRGPTDPSAGSAHELLGVCAVMELVSSGARTRSPEYARLTARAQALVARLAGTQSDKGQWTWIAGTGTVHAETGCAAMIALAKAAKSGIAVPDEVLARGRSALQRAFVDTSLQADETKALLSWALAVNDAGDFGALNRLHRQRASLTPAALAYTTLALAAMERGSMAAEMADELERRSAEYQTVDRRPACSFQIEGNSAWLRSPIEMTALAALALESAKPRSERLAQAIEYLLARRPWYDGRSRGLAVAAVAGFQGQSEPAAGEVRVSVRVAGGAPRTVALGKERGGERLTFPIGDDAPAGVAVELRLEGRGAPHFSAVLRGFTKDITSDDPTLRVSAHEYLAARPRYRGTEIPTGFGVLVNDATTWRNTVSDVEFGELVRCTLEVSRPRSRDARAQDEDYLVAEIPLPAGTRVLDGSPTAGGDPIEQRGGVLYVHLGRLRGSREIEYTLVGSVPGAYRTLPAVVRSVYAPGRVEVASAAPELKVLARAENSSNATYRATPDELYHLGQAMFAAGERETARELLQRLVDEHEANLRDSVLSQTAKSLLFVSIDRRAARDIVRYFEILKEKDPELYVPFEQVLAVGAAYREIDEHERALSIFRATIEETFGKELRVVDALENEQELSGAVDTLARLCAEYPDVPAVVASSLTLSDKLLRLAPRAASEPSLKRAQRDRARLLYEGILELQRFLALHPRDPQAPEAGLNLMTAHLALDDYAHAAELGEELAAAYSEPRFADAFLYSRAVAMWYLGEDDVALGLLQRIADAEYTDATGKKTPSPNRELALYILGQIHHARQEFGEAAGYYERVSEVFADARETLAALREKKIELPELTRVRPGEKVQLELSHRNVGEAEVLVYPVDLMTLYLREKNLARITQVNLSGIAPTIRRTLKLEGDDGVRPAKVAVELSLGEPGAYLVICRGDELHASGLVLVSDLELDVKEDAASGHVRVQVVDRSSGHFVRDVDVRVVGTRNADFVMGRTDPRGLFAADGIVGAATVIARGGERQYAFHRGTVALASAQNDRQAQQSLGDQKARYWDNVIDLNDSAVQQRGINFQEEVQRERKGVQVRQVK